MLTLTVLLSHVCQQPQLTYMPATSGSGLFNKKRCLRLVIEYVAASVLSEVLARNIKRRGEKPVPTPWVPPTDGCRSLCKMLLLREPGRLLVTVAPVHCCHLSFHMLLQGFVTVSLTGQSFNTTSGGEISLSAAPLTYRKQTACIPVVTTASEYT